MNAKHQSYWQKNFAEVIDQRSETLPPAWVARSITKAPLSEQQDELYASGKNRLMAQALIKMLNQARQQAILSSFLLADKDIEDAILAAAERGVRIYTLLASEARLDREESEGEFDRKVLKQHKDMLNRLGGYALFRSAPHFHAKLVITDPHTNPAGILLTANLTREALERNEELGLQLKASEVKALLPYLRWGMWESAEHELINPKDRFKAVKPLGRVPHPKTKPSSPAVTTTAHSNSIRDAALELIDGAKSQIMVSSFGWDEGHELVQRLCKRAKEGISVTILARVRAASMPALLALARSGAKIYGFKWLHAKAIWTDAEQALLMSANLQTHGLDQGFELGLRFSGARAVTLRKRLLNWTETAPWELVFKPKLGSITGTAQLWNDKQFDDIQVQTRKELKLDTVTANSADYLQAPRPNVPSAGVLPHLAHELHCTWVVTAPSVAPKAKEQFRKGEKPNSKQEVQNPKKEVPCSYDPPVFREAKDRLVVAIRTPDELQKALEVKAEVGAAAIVLAKGVR